VKTFMELSKSKLKQIIKEELARAFEQRLLLEGSANCDICPENEMLYSLYNTWMSSMQIGRTEASRKKQWDEFVQREGSEGLYTVYTTYQTAEQLGPASGQKYPKGLYETWAVAPNLYKPYFLRQLPSPPPDGETPPRHSCGGQPWEIGTAWGLAHVENHLWDEDTGPPPGDPCRTGRYPK